METIKQVGIWIRVSTDKQGDSPEHHEARARAYAKWKGWEISKTYLLVDMSGKSIFDYPQTKEMIADLKGGHIKALVFSKLARVARNTKELLELSDIFKKHDATLVSLDESIDTSTAAGMVYYTLLAALAQFELSEISSRVSASIPIRAKLGKPLGGQASFGYKWHDGKFVIDEEEAPIRKLMYELFLQTQRKKTTADELNKRAYRTRGGFLFSDNTVGRLLKDTNAKGQRLANYTKSNGKRKSPILKPEEEWVFVPCPAIVEEVLWNKCNQILNEQEAKTKRPGPKAVYLLTGFVKCHCGTTMYVKSAKNYSCRTCKNRIGVEDIDEIYLEYLKGYLRDVNPSLYTNEATVTLNEKEQLLIVANKKRLKLRKQMDDLIPLRLSNELSKEHFAELYKPLEEQVKQFDTSIPELLAEIDFRKIQIASSDVVLMEARELYEEWQDMEHEQKRAIVETITEYITIGKDEIDIALCYLPSLQIAEKVDTSGRL